MAYQTENEKKALLILFKDFTSYHNANTISKQLGISRIGSMKLLKKLKAENLVIATVIGKSTVYKPNMQDSYVLDLITFILAEEANEFKRWKEEFKELFVDGRIILLYGSTIRDYTKARDIDIMILRKAGDSGQIHKVISEKQQLLPKKIHAIDLTSQEFMKNVQNKQVAVIDIVKNAIILYGQNKYAELLKNVSSL
ncbi:MAG: hypothetical protein AABX96_05230 [Nanoarchaeota archaeon]